VVLWEEDSGKGKGKGAVLDEKKTRSSRRSEDTDKIFVDFWMQIRICIKFLQVFICLLFIVSAIRAVGT